MANVIPLTSNRQGYTETAIVQGSSDKHFIVLTDRGIVSVSVAFSCLVNPEVGDQVLMNSTATDSHILAILARPTGDDMDLCFPGNAVLESRLGQINVRAGKGMKLTTAEDIQLTSTALNLTAVDANVYTAHLNISGDKLVSRWREVRTVSEALHMVVDTVTQKIKNSFRTVDGVDQQSSLNFMQTVKKTLSIRSHHAVITARKDMKIDGERIHMG